MPNSYENLIAVHPGALRQEAVKNLQSNEVFLTFPNDIRQLIIFFAQEKIITQFHGASGVHPEAAEYMISEAINIANIELESARRELSKQIKHRKR